MRRWQCASRLQKTKLQISISKLNRRFKTIPAMIFIKIAFYFPSMKLLKDSFKTPFPYFFNNEKKNALLCIGVCVFLMGFILTFNPKAIHHIDKTVLIVLFTLSVLLPGIILAPRIFPIQFDPVGWTFGKHLAFTAF